MSWGSGSRRCVRTASDVSAVRDVCSLCFFALHLNERCKCCHAVRTPVNWSIKTRSHLQPRPLPNNTVPQAFEHRTSNTEVEDRIRTSRIEHRISKVDVCVLGRFLLYAFSLGWVQRVSRFSSHGSVRTVRGFTNPCPASMPRSVSNGSVSTVLFTRFGSHGSKCNRKSQSKVGRMCEFLIYCLFASLLYNTCLLYTSPSPRDTERSRMPSSA